MVELSESLLFLKEEISFCHRDLEFGGLVVVEHVPVEDVGEVDLRGGAGANSEAGDTARELRAEYPAEGGLECDDEAMVQWPGFQHQTPNVLATAFPERSWINLTDRAHVQSFHSISIRSEIPFTQV